MSTLTFSVADLTCEAAQKVAIRPRITLLTTSVTVVRSRHGWPAYGGDDSVLYKTLTPTGSHVQKNYTSPLVKVWTPGGLNIHYGDQYLGGAYAGGLKNTYSGYSQIDIYGNLISRHRKDVTVSCDHQPFPNVSAAVAVPGGVSLALLVDVSRGVGYCWIYDPTSCAACSDNENTWGFLANYSVSQPHDYPYESIYDPAGISTSPTVLTYSRHADEFYSFFIGTTNYPTGEIDFVSPTGIRAWVRMSSDGTWSFTLSDPYTAADSEASKVQYIGTGSIAENTPVYASWISNYIHHVSSRQTAVSFNLHCVNLIAGANYRATYELWNMATNVHTTVVEQFAAIASTHDISGTVPTPAANQTIKIRNPAITAI